MCDAAQGQGSMVKRMSAALDQAALTPLHAPRGPDAREAAVEGGLVEEGAVQKLAAETQRRFDDRNVAPRQGIDEAVRAAQDAVRASGVEVDAAMVRAATARAAQYFGTSPQSAQDHAQKCFLVEAAVKAAITEAGDSTGSQIEQARLAASSVAALDFDTMKQNAQKVLLGRGDPTYVFQVHGYTKAGVDLVLSLATLAGNDFEVRVQTGASVRDVICRLVEDRDLRCHRNVGMKGAPKVTVKLIGPAGTLLDKSRLLPEAIDYECDASPAACPDDGPVYPLSVLVGEQWKALGLDGPTRWKYLSGQEFLSIFGMSKQSFEQLKPWTQASMRRKHGLF